jgi:predicted ester cyclase
MIAEGDKVVTRFTMRGTHQGEFMGIAPTGRRVEMTGIDIIRFSDGKMVEHWGNTDDLGMMQQLGVIPEPGQEEVEPSH